MTTLPTNINEAKNIAEQVLLNNNFDFEFIGMSDTNGLSVYFRVGELKVRFSDHGISNSSRMQNEICFKFGENEFNFSQSILKLQFELGYDNVEYGQIDYVRYDGRVLKAFGYKTI